MCSSGKFSNKKFAGEQKTIQKFFVISEDKLDDVDV
jgi:hypothetical protein